MNGTTRDVGADQSARCTDLSQNSKPNTRGAKHSHPNHYQSEIEEGAARSGPVFIKYIVNADEHEVR